jgi:CelD/BcsL family acetyltransferase involved in cellulose biosynthesis
MRFKGLVPALGPASGVWSRCGDLLLDPEADALEACRLLLSAVRGLGRMLLWCDAAPYLQAAWQALQRAAEQKGWAPACIEQPAVGQVDVRHDWDEYWCSRSRGHRRALRRAEQRAAAAGGVELAWHAEPSPELAGELVRLAFELEHAGWKGRCGGSVLSVPGLVSFFERQARQLAVWRQVRFAFLMCAGRPIAFEYAPCAKGVYHAVKVGYDQQWRDLAPGQLLRLHAYRAMFGDRSMRCIDFAGPLTHATARWSTHEEPRGCLLVPANAAGRAALAAYCCLRPLVGRLRRACTAETERARPVGGPRAAAPR